MERERNRKFERENRKTGGKKKSKITENFIVRNKVPVFSCSLLINKRHQPLFFESTKRLIDTLFKYP